MKLIILLLGFVLLLSSSGYAAIELRYYNISINSTIHTQLVRGGSLAAGTNYSYIVIAGANRYTSWDSNQVSPPSKIAWNVTNSTHKSINITSIDADVDCWDRGWQKDTSCTDTVYGYTAYRSNSSLVPVGLEMFECWLDGTNCGRNGGVDVRSSSTWQIVPSDTTKWILDDGSIQTQAVWQYAYTPIPTGTPIIWYDGSVTDANITMDMLLNWSSFLGSTFIKEIAHNTFLINGTFVANDEASPFRCANEELIIRGDLHRTGAFFVGNLDTSTPIPATTDGCTITFTGDYLTGNTWRVGDITNFYGSQVLGRFRELKNANSLSSTYSNMIILGAVSAGNTYDLKNVYVSGHSDKEGNNSDVAFRAIRTGFATTPQTITMENVDLFSLRFGLNQVSPISSDSIMKNIVSVTTSQAALVGSNTGWAGLMSFGPGVFFQSLSTIDLNLLVSADDTFSNFKETRIVNTDIGNDVLRIQVEGSALYRQMASANIRVVDDSGNPLNNAVVTFTYSNGTQAFSETTNSSGRIPYQILTRKILNATCAVNTACNEATELLPTNLEIYDVDVTASGYDPFSYSFNLSQAVQPDVLKGLVMDIVMTNRGAGRIVWRG